MNLKSKLSLLMILMLVVATFSTVTALAADKISYYSMWEKGEPQQKVLDRAIRDFEEEYGVEVETHWTGRDVITAVKPRLISGEGIDLIDQAGEELYGGLVRAEVAADIADVLTKQIPGEENTVKDVLKDISYQPYLEDGSLYMIPYNLISSAFWYNENLFSELGITPPETWEEFLQVAQVLKDNGYDPVSKSANTLNYNIYYLQLAAVRIMGNGALREAIGDSTGEAFADPGWARVGDIIYTFSKNGKNLFEKNYGSMSWPAPQMNWVMGKTGMYYCGSWIPIETSTAAGPDFKYASFQFPKFKDAKGNQNSVESYPIGFSVPSVSDNKDLAKKLITYILKKEYTVAWVEDTKNMTPRKGIKAPEALKDIQVSMENADTFHRFTGGIQSKYPGWYANVANPVLKSLILGKIDGEEFAAQLQKKTRDFWKSK